MKRLILLLVIVLNLFSANVILDPGHGGTDSGATGPSYWEKNANLDVAFYAKSYLESAGVTVGMTRSTDIYVSLDDRCSIANSGGYERFMSIHENAFDASVQGTETYCYTSGSSNSFDLRDCVHPQLIWAHSYYNRGTKTASFYVLVHTSMPAILGEGTFIDYTSGWNESWRYLTNWNDHEGRQGFAYANGYCTHRSITAPVYGGGTGGDSIIVDNSDPEFTSGGSWNDGTYSGGWEDDYIWCDGTDTIQSWARWQPDLPNAGEYSIYMWWLAGANRCDNVFIRIFGTGNDSMFVSQKGLDGEWHYLGNYDFYAGNGGYVSLGDRTAIDGDVVIADAVMWVYNGPLSSKEKPLEPTEYSIKTYPNPFNSAVQIEIKNTCEEIQKLVPSKVDIFDVKGNLIVKIAFSTGEPTIWSPNESVPAGIYFARMASLNTSFVKLLYLK
ncbi:N-acetylmuramoyl-L-alanine amidase [bacterium]|nr:N-acetylmuramoyl-L-alanine amidase [bacterium]